jgi:hypothetical protein
MDVIYKNVFNRTFEAEKAGLAAMQRQLRLRYEELLAAEGAPENTEKRQRAMDRLKASHLHEEYLCLCDELEAEEARRVKLLNKMASKVELRPHGTMYLVQKVTIDVPRPPGTNPRTYLDPIQEMIGRRGFSSHVRVTDRHYEMWANCPPWMVDAINRVSS